MGPQCLNAAAGVWLVQRAESLSAPRQVTVNAAQEQRQ